MMVLVTNPKKKGRLREETQSNKCFFSGFSQKEKMDEENMNR